VELSKCFAVYRIREVLRKEKPKQKGLLLFTPQIVENSSKQVLSDMSESKVGLGL
jgi:hypothetical protein